MLTDVSRMSRNDIVPHYAELIARSTQVTCKTAKRIRKALDNEVIALNKLILSKWSSKGLEYIKDNAWKSLGYSLKINKVTNKNVRVHITCVCGYMIIDERIMNIKCTDFSKAGIVRRKDRKTGKPYLLQQIKHAVCCHKITNDDLPF